MGLTHNPLSGGRSARNRDWPAFPEIWLIVLRTGGEMIRATVGSSLFIAATVLWPFSAELKGQGDLGAGLQLEKLPLVFNPNVGQAEESVRFTTRGQGYSLYFTDREAVLLLAPAKNKKAAVLRLTVPGSRPDTN